MDEEKEDDTTNSGTIEKRANLKAPTHPRLRMTSAFWERSQSNNQICWSYVQQQ